MIMSEEWIPQKYVININQLITYKILLEFSQ